MPVWHTIQSDQIVVVPSGLRVAAIVRTVHAEAVLDPDAATTTIAEPLARRLPAMPDQARRAFQADVLTLPHRIDVTLRTAHHPIGEARFAAALPDGAELSVGRDVLVQEAFRLDFVANRIAALAPSDEPGLARGFTPLRLTLTGKGYVAAFGDKPLAFRSDASRTPGSVVRTIAYGALTLPIHDAGRDGRWIGWDAFAGRRIVLDLAHRTIWIEKPAS